MVVEIIRTGSAGNLYRIADSSTTLMIDAGFKLNAIKKLLNFKLHEIDAVLITHEHCDHAVGVKELVKTGVKTVLSRGTASALGVEGEHNVICLYPIKIGYEKLRVGTFEILAFQTYHDATEPVGFLITSLLTKERLLFATDTCSLPYYFPNLHYILLEINYSDEVLKEVNAKGSLPVALYKKIRETHMSEKAALEFLKNQNLSECKEFYAIHRSDKHSSDNLLEKIKPLFGEHTILEA